MLRTHLNSFFCHLGRAVKNDLNLTVVDYRKVLRVIKSCQCTEHLAVANRLITNFYMKHDDNKLLERLEKRYIKKQKTIV